MWIATTFGFFSIVQAKTGSALIVRARCRDDLSRFVMRLPRRVPIHTTVQSDYPVRIAARAEDVATVLANAVTDIFYPNFKAEVAKTNKARSKTYESVWMALREIENE